MKNPAGFNTILMRIRVVSCFRDALYIEGGPKNGYPVLFGDNFGNSAPILTILSLLQA